MTGWRAAARGESRDATPAEAGRLAAEALRTGERGGGVRPERVLLWVAVEEGSAAADRAFWETAASDGGRFASPAGFAATLPSFAAGDIAIALGLTGPVLVEAGAGACDAFPPEAVARALRAAGAIDGVLAVRLRAGSVEAVLLVPDGGA